MCMDNFMECCASLLKAISLEWVKHYTNQLTVVVQKISAELRCVSVNQELITQKLKENNRYIIQMLHIFPLG